MNYDKAREIMVDTQVRPNDVSDPEIVSAFMKTPREAFVPSSRKSVAYSELEIETSEGRSLWTPRDTGKLVKLAGIKPTDIVLVVGAGSGYEAALISRLAETVIALEEGEARVDAMSERFTALGIDQAVAVEGDIAKGLPDQAPFDVIYVCGMVETLPEAWTEQLAEGGVWPLSCRSKKILAAENSIRAPGIRCLRVKDSTRFRRNSQHLTARRHLFSKNVCSATSC